MASNICDRLRVGIETASAEETRSLAAAFALVVPDDTVLALHGDLGVGKTTFVQGLAAGLRIQEPVTSPTFNLFSLYQNESRRLLHVDAYRLENGDQVDALLLEDFMITPWIAAIEWPERIADWLPTQTWHLTLGITATRNHTIKLDT
jgi:tRNA threonylcarbamoyladenosine biosynthesis protein TsaE